VPATEAATSEFASSGQELFVTGRSPSGHRLNVKFGIGKTAGGNLADRWRLTLQFEVLVP
jgi:hypothetical protein